MNALLANLALYATFAISPALLLARFLWPRILPRWGLLILAAIFGGIALYTSECFRYADAFSYLGPEAFPFPPNVDGMVVIRGPGRTEFMLGAMLQLGYLLLWLVPYGVVRILLDRKAQPHRVAAHLARADA